MKMKTRAIVATVVAFVLLAAAIGAGLNAVFTVTHVRADFRTYSAEGASDAAELRQTLDGFVGKSTTFLDLGDVKAAVEEYPGFRVEEIAKQFPATVRLVVSERKESFAFAREEGGYAILDAEGNYLYDKEENINRVAGENILLNGFALTVRGGQVEGDYYGEWLEAAGAFRDALDEIRSNLVSVDLVRPTSIGRYDFFRIHMREGVVIDIGNPALGAAEKAKAAVEKYLSLSDENRIFGFITALDDVNTGEILVPDYTRDSRLS